MVGIVSIIPNMISAIPNDYECFFSENRLGSTEVNLGGKVRQRGALRLNLELPGTLKRFPEAIGLKLAVHLIMQQIFQHRSIMIFEQIFNIYISRKYFIIHLPPPLL